MLKGKKQIPLWDIMLYNSPSYEELINELHRISCYKAKIYKRVKNVDEFHKNLSVEEKKILNDLSQKENNIILEILTKKHWPSFLKDNEDKLFKYFDKKLVLE